MGQVFTDKVDVTKLKEGMRLKVYTRHDSFTGVAFFDDDLDDKGWGIRGEEDGLFWACYSNGDFRVCVDSVEILDADPAEKMQAEHAEMLEIMQKLRDVYCNPKINEMVCHFFKYRKDAQ